MFANLKLPTILVVLLIICAGTLAAVLAYFETTVKADYSCRADYSDKVNVVLIQRNDVAEKLTDAQAKLLEDVGNMILHPDTSLSKEEQSAKFAELFRVRQETSDQIQKERAQILMPEKPACVMK